MEGEPTNDNLPSIHNTDLFCGCLPAQIRVNRTYPFLLFQVKQASLVSKTWKPIRTVERPVAGFVLCASTECSHANTYFEVKEMYPKNLGPLVGGGELETNHDKGLFWLDGSTNLYSAGKVP